MNSQYLASAASSLEDLLWDTYKSEAPSGSVSRSMSNDVFASSSHGTSSSVELSGKVYVEH